MEVSDLRQNGWEQKHPNLKLHFLPLNYPLSTINFGVQVQPIQGWNYLMQ
jgi:hypothetical protein